MSMPMMMGKKIRLPTTMAMIVMAMLSMAIMMPMQMPLTMPKVMARMMRPTLILPTDKCKP